jgi:hypothetical protein
VFANAWRDLLGTQPLCAAMFSATKLPTLQQLSSIKQHAPAFLHLYGLLLMLHAFSIATLSNLPLEI